MSGRQKKVQFASRVNSHVQRRAQNMDFNTPRIWARWHAGLSDGRRMIARQAWLTPVGTMDDGLVLHDLDPV